MIEKYNILIDPTMGASPKNTVSNIGSGTINGSGLKAFASFRSKAKRYQKKKLVSKKRCSA
jgi:hypothetical protein